MCSPPPARLDGRGQRAGLPWPRAHTVAPQSMSIARSHPIPRAASTQTSLHDPNSRFHGVGRRLGPVCVCARRLSRVSERADVVLGRLPLSLLVCARPPPPLPCHRPQKTQGSPARGPHKRGNGCLHLPSRWVSRRAQAVAGLPDRAPFSFCGACLHALGQRMKKPTAAPYCPTRLKTHPSQVPYTGAWPSLVGHSSHSLPDVWSAPRHHARPDEGAPDTGAGEQASKTARPAAATRLGRRASRPREARRRRGMSVCAVSVARRVCVLGMAHATRGTSGERAACLPHKK